MGLCPFVALAAAIAGSRFDEVGRDCWFGVLASRTSLTGLATHGTRGVLYSMASLQLLADPILACLLRSDVALHLNAATTPASSELAASMLAMCQLAPNNGMQWRGGHPSWISLFGCPFPSTASGRWRGGRHGQETLSENTGARDQSYRLIEWAGVRRMPSRLLVSRLCARPLTMTIALALGGFLGIRSGLCLPLLYTFVCRRGCC